MRTGTLAGSGRWIDHEQSLPKRGPECVVVFHPNPDCVAGACWGINAVHHAVVHTGAIQARKQTVRSRMREIRLTRHMARAMVLTAATQTLIGLLAMHIVWDGAAVLLPPLMAGAWLASSVLFRVAAERPMRWSRARQDADR